jgi:hypothetical protein
MAALPTRKFYLFIVLIGLVCLSGRAVGQDIGSSAPAVNGESRAVSDQPLLPLISTLTVAILDASTGDTIAARCSVTDANGEPRHPPLAESFYHTADGGYFYSWGLFMVDVPEGRTIVRAGCGCEYRPLVDTLDVQGDTTVTYELERMVDMGALGYFSGDCQVHINHAGGYYTMQPEDALLMGSAEGLGIVNCLDNAYYFTGDVDPCSTPECIVYMSEENRSSTYGHMDLLGLHMLIYPFSSGWWPMCGDIARAAGGQEGVAVISAHPISTDDFQQIDNWPGSGLARELPVNVFEGGMDGFEVMSYSNMQPGGIEIDFWYKLLNCGYRITACAGTDAAVNRYTELPAGGMRTYVRIPEGALTFDGWISNLVAGRTFVTNHPLITHFDIVGFEPGDEAEITTCCELSGRLAFQSVQPVSRAEIIRNGEVVKTFDLGSGRNSVDTVFTVEVTESSWIAARVTGYRSGWHPVGSILFAHTNPVFFTVGGRRIVKRDAAEFFVQWISDLEALFVAEGTVPSSSDSIRVISKFIAARQHYQDLANSVTGVKDGVSHPPTPMPLIARNEPNPFSTVTQIYFGIEQFVGQGVLSYPGNGGDESSGELVIYDVQGRVVRRLFDGEMPAGLNSVFWDGRDERGSDAASGIYFCIFRAGGRSVSRKLVLIR